MTDRGLLEAAARAAGWEGWRSKHGYWNLTSPEGAKHVCCNYWPAYDESTGEKLQEPGMADALVEAGWNPITDDGDALRLAVTLRISLDMLTHIVDATTGTVMCHEPWGDDHCAATRRAIVRAAAAMAGTQGEPV
jgi:hypothetical protein